MFDDVVIAAKNIFQGVEGSVPEIMVEGEKNICVVEFDLGNYIEIQNRNNLNIIAILISKAGGKIINANFVRMSVETAIAGVDADSENVVQTARYSADVHRTTTVAKGC